MSNTKITLKIGGSREGPDYRFYADAETLKQVARQILRCLEEGKPGPWGRESATLVCEEIKLESRGLFGARRESAFFSIELE
jgi:hypothetical protein